MPWQQHCTNRRRLAGEAVIALTSQTSTHYLQPLVHARMVKINLGMHLTGLRCKPEEALKAVWNAGASPGCGQDLARLVNLIPAQLGAFGELIDEDDVAF